MKNTRKQQRGAGLRLPTDDAYSKAYSYINFTTELDKQLGRLDIFSKMKNMKELVSWIFLEKGEVMKAAKKSNTSTFTQIGKRYITNRYTVPYWFNKNFITRDQMKDYFKNNGNKYYLTIHKYLKQLYILITGSNEGWNPVEEYPVLGTPSESFRSKLAQIFGEDVMDRFVENYNDVKSQIEEQSLIDLKRGTSDSAAGNPLDNVAGNTHAFHADNVAGNDNAWDPDNLAYDRKYAHETAAAGVMGGTRRRRRNKSNKRRKTRK